MILVFIAFCIITIIPIITGSYNQSLENSLATKQPHILVKYINDKTIYTQKQIQDIQNDLISILNPSSITNINAFVQTNSFINLKSYGNNLSEYKGYIDAIGLVNTKYSICYNFDTFTPVMLNNYGFKLTGIELFEEFRKKENKLFFNKSLYHSIEPLVTYQSNFDISFDETNNKISKGNFMAIVEDFYDKPIVYMNYKYLNKILGYDENHITGFMININNQKDLNLIKGQTENHFNKKQNIVFVSTWRELNKKQNDIFKIFTKVGEFLKWIILILATFAVTIFIYKSLLVKQPEFRLLNILGLRLILIVNIIISLFTAITVGISTYLTHILMQYIYTNILNQNMIVQIDFYIYDVVLSYFVLVLSSIVIINSLFKQKYNIFK